MAKMITSLQNPIVKHLVRLHQNRDYREEHRSVVIEGTTLIQDVAKKHHMKLIMVLDETMMPPNIEPDEVFIATPEILKKITGLLDSEGVIAEITMPMPVSLKGKRWILALDGVRDPGNLGTLLRSGLAFGWEGAFILPNSCDPFNDKAIRSGKGATFALPIALGEWKDLKQLIKLNQLSPLVADMNGMPFSEVKVEEGVLLVLNNESQGISEEAENNCKRVSIPMMGPMESLNVAVAGGILMYELRHKRPQ